MNSNNPKDGAKFGTTLPLLRDSIARYSTNPPMGMGIGIPPFKLMVPSPALRSHGGLSLQPFGAGTQPDGMAGVVVDDDGL